MSNSSVFFVIKNTELLDNSIRYKHYCNWKYGVTRSYFWHVFSLISEMACAATRDILLLYGNLVSPPFIHSSNKWTCVCNIYNIIKQCMLQGTFHHVLLHRLFIAASTSINRVTWVSSSSLRLRRWNSTQKKKIEKMKALA